MNIINTQLYIIWLYLTIGILVYGIFVIFLPSLIPTALAQIYRYGKTAQKPAKSFLTNIVTVPKRWFLHFYILACTFHVFIIWSVLNVYLWKNPPSAILRSAVGILAPEKWNVPVSPESVVVAMSLMLLQVFRRLYECLYVSVFSDAKMSLLHYGFGLYFYPAVGMSLILEAPGFINSDIPSLSRDKFVCANHIFGSVIFIIGWCIEFNSHCILSNLRRNSKGEVVSKKYVIPKGGLFKYVSCPNYFGEVVMYLAVLIIFAGRNITWWSVLLNVLTNQIFAALMAHHWYIKKFDNYPKKRKALIPFLL